ncbi:putative oxidoreductase GLYR1 [Nephila pilipes]|uniref:Putative oxidoreductase GLYR1 n=1 Tax=Nephila pilipes TaxID=299642 RepID=A0A8X6TR72_NEPPI|nr:putative oxidoreductase GLYR1 [Nephila pilipes]
MNIQILTVAEEQIIKPLSSGVVKKSKKYVIFFGGKEHAWVSEKNLLSFGKNYEALSKHKKVNFQIALKAVAKYQNIQKFQNENNQDLNEILLLVCEVSNEAKDEVLHVQSFSCNFPDQSEFPEVVERMAPREADVKVTREECVSIPFHRIGFIGIGQMGFYLCRMLAEFGFHITIWNRTQDKCERLLSIGVHWANSPKDLVAMCDVTFCCLKGDDVVEEVIIGKKNPEKSASKSFKLYGHTKGLIMISTILPELSQKLSEIITSRGSKYLEAPIIFKIMSMDLFFLCAGDQALYRKLLGFFSRTGAVFYRLNEIGQALKMKQVYMFYHSAIVLNITEVAAQFQSINSDLNELHKKLKEAGYVPPIMLNIIHGILHQNWYNGVSISEAQSNVSQVLCSHPDKNFRIARATLEILKLGVRNGLGNAGISAVFNIIKPRPTKEESI